MRGHAKTVSCACIYASRGEGGRAIVHIYMHPAVRGLIRSGFSKFLYYPNKKITGGENSQIGQLVGVQVKAFESAPHITPTPILGLFTKERWSDYLPAEFNVC